MAKRRRNEIVIFLINLFFMQMVAKYFVLGILWLFRFFGMPQLWQWYSLLDHPARIRFYIVLAVCTAISIYRIKKGDTTNKK